MEQVNNRSNTIFHSNTASVEEDYRFTEEPMTSPDTPSEAVDVQQRITTFDSETYMVIDPGTKQHTLGAGHRIISLSEFTCIEMGCTSNQLGSIGMYPAICLTVVKSTEGPVILISHQAITYNQARRE